MKVVELNEKCSRCQEVLNADEILPYDMALASEKSSNDDTVSANVTGVKIKLLIKELAELRKKDKTAKVLIFSQYVKTLNVLKKQLEKAGLKYRTLTGDMSLSKRKKALNMFQNDPPTTVFLLSIRAGAVGINLTQANFIVLLDACTNPALEAQAIGRVWRLGQKRKVHIRRYIMKDSIETRILEMEAEKNRKNVVEEEDEDEEEETKKNDDSTTNSTTTATTTTSTSKKKGSGSRNDPISIGFKETAVAGSIMSSTQRFRVNEFIKLFGVKDSELPDMYKREQNSDDGKKKKKKNNNNNNKKKSKKRKKPSPSTNQSKKARRDEEECVIS